MALKTANNQSMTAITSLPSGVSAKSMILLATETASSSDTISFASGIDSTYKEYQIHWTDVHPSNDDVGLTVGFRDGSTAYDASKTTTAWRAYHSEGDTTTFAYYTAIDHQNTTGFQYVTGGTGNDNDTSVSGILNLYDPSSTTFTKHFLIRSLDHVYTSDAGPIDLFIAGYCNTTTAIDGVQFKFSAGTIDAGTFKLYGVV